MVLEIWAYSSKRIQSNSAQKVPILQLIIIYDYYKHVEFSHWFLIQAEVRNTHTHKEVSHLK